MSKKTADFVCSEPPTIETEGDTDRLNKLLQVQNFNSKLYESMIDISRYGNAVLKIVDKRATIVDPCYWFPIVDKTDLKTVTHHVIAYPVDPDANGKMTKLYVEIHTPGKIEVRNYNYDADKSTIGNMDGEAETQTTGIDGFAIFPLTNVTHSGSIYGIDDYTIVNSIVQKIMWRLHCSDVVLDKHSAPTMTGPSNHLSYDPVYKMHFFDLGNFVTRDDIKQPELKYVTWDGNLDSSFKEIDLLFNQLYILSEMGQAFIEGGGGGTASSGTALKLRMVSPRIKAARITQMNEATVKHLVYSLAQVNGVAINYDTLNIKWHDGLPEDEQETVNTLVTATGGKPVMSQYSALKRRGLSDKDVEAELEQIQEETATTSPTMLGVVEHTYEGGKTDDSENI